MTDPHTSIWRRRHAWEWIALIALPVVLNVALAAFLFGPARNGELPGFGSSLPLPSGEIGHGLPRTNFEEILIDVRKRTGRGYPCEQPWRSSNETTAWACREQDSLAVLRGVSPAVVFAIEVTWFGFDPSATDLPAWAAAAFERDTDARQAANWVAEHVGGGSATTMIDGAQLRLGGARGALTFDVRR